MRVCAILAVRNEQQFIGCCIGHLADQGLYVAVIDNDSDDGTAAILDELSPRVVVHRERFPYRGYFDLEGLLARKQHLSQILDFDWFMHVDADEIPESPIPLGKLAEAVDQADAEGYNAINFDEFVFVPQKNELSLEPYYDYQSKERYYYYFAPRENRLVRLWRKNDRIDLVSSAGHSLSFPGKRTFPQNFILRHYIALSRRQLVEKYLNRVFPDMALARGWHANRVGVGASVVTFPSISELHEYSEGRKWETSRPRRTHFFDPRHAGWH